VHSTTWLKYILTRADLRCVPRLRILKASIGFRSHLIEKVVEGVPFKFYIASPLAEVWYGKESDSSIEMRFVRGLMLSLGSKVIECGAHYGCTKILLANWVRLALTTKHEMRNPLLLFHRIDNLRFTCL
jgi:hypothetical protein